MWWALGVVYYVGALLTLRHEVLSVYELREKHYKRYGPQVKSKFTMAFVPIFVIWWPAVAFCWISWKLIFPKGVKTREVKRREREARREVERRAQEEAQARFEENIRRAEELLKEWAPKAMGPGSSATPIEVLTYELAAASFNGHCEQVWQDRGKPWSIGALARVHARAKAAMKS